MINHSQMYAKKKFRLYHILVLLLGVALLSCATPISPTGGPRDKEGPKILKTSPESGTVNFDGKRFEFQFSEYVNRASVLKNITIEPDLGIDYALKWKKKTMFIEFKNKLPDSTTVILTLGTDISDTKSNKMTEPIKIAISTGNEIDKGSISGRLKRAEDGSSLESGKVLLYRSPVDLSKPATYQAETDTGGVFLFSYLREGRYKAIYVDDRNRNKIWDKKGEIALPFSTEFVNLKKAGSDTLEVLYVVRIDTLPPRLQGVGMLSSTRLRLRFNENIKVQESNSIDILDSLLNEISSAYPLYISKKDPFVVYAHSENSLPENTSFSLTLNGITDFSSNKALSNDILFEGSSQADTTLQRIIGHKTKGGVFPTQSIEIAYAAPIANPMIIDSIVVVEGDVSFDDWPLIRTEKNTLFIDPQEKWIEGLEYQFLVWDPSSNRRKLFKTEIWSEADLGELTIDMAFVDSTKSYRFSLENEAIQFKIDSTFTNQISLTGLAPTTYTLTIFEDLNKNGVWDSGSITPYLKPEPYYIQRGVTVQGGFTSEIIIQF